MGCQQSVEEESASSTAPVSPTPEDTEDKAAVSSSEEENKDSVELLNNALNGVPPTSTASRPSSSSSQSKGRAASARSRNSAKSNGSARSTDFVEPSLPGAIPGNDHEERLDERTDKETGEEIVSTSRTNSSMSNSMPNGELERLKKVSERPCTPSPASAASIERKLSGKSMNGDLVLLTDHNSKDNISTDAQTQLERQQSVGSLAKLRTAADELPKISEYEELNVALSKEESADRGIVITLNSDEQSINVDDSTTNKNVVSEDTKPTEGLIQTKSEVESMNHKEGNIDKKVKFEDTGINSQNDDSVLLNGAAKLAGDPISAKLKSASFEEFDQLPEDNKSENNQKIDSTQSSPIENEIYFPESTLSKLTPLTSQTPESLNENESNNRNHDSPEQKEISFSGAISHLEVDDSTTNNVSDVDKSNWEAEDLNMELGDGPMEDETPCSLAASSSGLILPRPMTSYKKVSQHRIVSPDDGKSSSLSGAPSATENQMKGETDQKESTNDGEDNNFKDENLEPKLSHIDESTSPPDLSTDVILSVTGSASKYKVAEEDESISKDRVEVSHSSSGSNNEENVDVQPDKAGTEENLKLCNPSNTTEVNQKKSLSEEGEQRCEKNHNLIASPEKEGPPAEDEGLEKLPDAVEGNTADPDSADNPTELNDLKSIKEIDLQEVGRLLSREISSVSQNEHIEENDISSVKAEVLGF